MKYVFTILSVFFILSCVVPLNAQPKYIIQMEDTLNLSSENQANGIAVDKDKNVYITGYFYNSNSNDDYLTAKYDSSGNLIWNVIIDNGDED
ncbi:MAG: hypothetical protein GWP03_05585, partial [Proteobacteria bacterium]|nr:hypothetical protein [Pseudomonadota bacterium]